MSTNADALVRDGIKAYREGRKNEARDKLLEAVELDEQNEQAWLWLSAVVDTVEDQQTCLENVLTINPNNEKARQGLAILSEKSSDSPAVTQSQRQTPAEPEDDDPFAGVSFTATETTTSPFSEEIDDFDEDEEELPADTQWDVIQTSSASAQPPPENLSSQDYDDWVSNLNLGSNEAANAFGDIPQEQEEEDDAFSSLTFTDDPDPLFDEETPFAIDDNVFSIESDDEDEGFTFDSGNSPFITDIDEDEEPEPVTSPVPPPIMSPTETNTAAAAEEDDLFGDIDNEIDDSLFDELDDEDYEADPEDMFRFIPSEIKATRLPGTRERYPRPLILSLLLLVLLNIGVMALVIMNLTGG